MKRLFQKLRKVLKEIFSIHPGTLRGVAIAMYILALFMVLLIPVAMIPYMGVHRALFYFIFLAGLLMLIGFGSLLVKKLLSIIPGYLLFGLVVLFFEVNMDFAGSLENSWMYAIGFVLLAWMIGGSGWVLVTRRFPTLPWHRKMFTLINFIGGLALWTAFLVFYKSKGKEIELPEIAALKEGSEVQKMDLPNPAKPGKYDVLSLYYGSGFDKQRPEYSDSVSIVTPLVDGSPFVDNWDKLIGKMRSRYWGYEVDSLPLNARVWYPEGDGPFPLALIVHGNHSGMEPSDPGYEYLGRLMASRGFIFASVDENFLNGGMTFEIFRSLNEENDLRGWMLLKHLEVWEEWNRTDTCLFYQKVDMENIALLGHSRGGEAVSVAAFFNRLSHYPDDARQTFDFGFSIKSIVAIAQVDGQYRPAEVGTPIHDVNYLTLQGSFDMDVDTYHGSRQFQRVFFSDTEFFFKSGVFVHRANHGQFNTVWGDNDRGYPGINWCNRKALISGEEQRTIGKIWMSAFLEATLKDKQEYVRFFRDYRSGGWDIPETVLLTQYSDNHCEYWCNYEEDLDVTTATLPQATISTELLPTWKEQMIKLKRGRKETMGVYLGWNQEENDSLPPKYMVDFSKPVALPEEGSLILSLIATDENPESLKGEEEEENEENSEDAVNESENEKTKSNNAEEGKGEEDDEEEEKKEPFDLSLVLMDADSNRASVPLHRFSYLQPRLEANIMKIESSYSNSSSENVFQYFEFPVQWFAGQNDQLDVSRIRQVSLVFDKTEKGVIVLDNLGVRKE